MSGISYNPEFSDVDNDGYASGAVAVSTTQVEAKVGASRLVGREGLTITNKGPNPVYYGPSGVTSTTGDVLLKNQFVSLPFGEAVAVFMICAAGQSASVIIQELA
jgi:hypothetical protein